jgi:hypothetical protein
MLQEHGPNFQAVRQAFSATHNDNQLVLVKIQMPIQTGTDKINKYSNPNNNNNIYEARNSPPLPESKLKHKCEELRHREVSSGLQPQEVMRGCELKAESEFFHHR